MKTSTLGIIVGSSALASAGAVKVSKGYQRKKKKMERQNEEFSAMHEVKKGIKQGVKAGTDKTTGVIKTGIEAEKEMIKGGINKTIEGVKSGIETQQRMMEKEKEMLDKMNESIQKKDMTMGVVVGSTALITTGLVLAFNAYQKKTGKLEDVGKTVPDLNAPDSKFIPDSDVQQEKDEKEAKDAERDPAYKGLTQLDTQYRDEWQANGIPQTHAEMEKLEKEGQENRVGVEALKDKLEKNNAE